jgi:hypothetical protein
LCPQNCQHSHAHDQENRIILPSFEGEPLTLPCAGSTEEVLDRYWQALDATNRVALAVKDIAADGRSERVLIRNRHS